MNAARKFTVTVQPIPEGYHSITPYLTVRGADRAIDFYRRAFGAGELSRMNGPDGKVQIDLRKKFEAYVPIGTNTNAFYVGSSICAVAPGCLALAKRSAVLVSS